MKKIAVFMLFGQSNAVGHAMPMDEKDYINVPLKNVFGLNRDPNQSYDITELKFTGYTSFGMNLAETQDNTYSVANCLAKNWQNWPIPSYQCVCSWHNSEYFSSAPCSQSSPNCF